MKCNLSPTGESWGLLVSLDLYHCNDRIADKDAIREFIVNLCDDVIHMKRFGECHVEYFGEPALGLQGYSAFQFIQTSCISAHFDDYGCAYIDVFSCAPFEPGEVSDFSVKYFGASSYNMVVTPRFYGSDDPRGKGNK